MKNREFSSAIPKPNDKVRSWHTSNSLRPKKAKVSESKIRTMLIFFPFLTVKVLFIRNLCLKDKQLINSAILRFLNDSEKGFILSGQRLRTLGCCITPNPPVTLQSPWTNFWPKRAFQWFRSPHTRLIWVRLTSYFSQNSNSTSKFVILELRTASKWSWQTSWGHLHMKTSSSDSNVSGGVWLPRGTTLEGIMLICSSVVNKKIITPVSLLFRHNSYWKRLGEYSV